MQSSPRIVSALLAVLVLALAVSSSLAGEIHLAWDAVPGALGYRVYYGTEPGLYPHNVTVGAQPSAVIRDLADCTTWYLAVKAYNSAGESTEFSGEVSGWPRPVVQSVAPAIGVQGAQFTVDLYGANYQAGAGLTLDDLTVPKDVGGNPLFRIESPTVLSCNRIQALVSIEPSARGVRAMPVGEFLFDCEVRNPDSVFGTAHLAFEIQFEPSRWDINRSHDSTTDRVDGADLSWLAYSYGSLEGEPLYNPDADLSGDGIVDGEDLAYLAAGFGRCRSGTEWTEEACV